MFKSLFKETIYTIPVTDGFNLDTECPFCAMKEKLEKDYISAFNASAYMEDDIRNETNLQGFCKKHFDMFLKSQNKLGFSLTSHTHLLTIIDILEKNKNPENAIKQLEKINKSCYLCNKIDNMLLKYFDTFIHLWQQEAKTKELVEKSKGFCLSHFYDLLCIGKKKLKSKEFAVFAETITRVELENLKILANDIECFSKKFDYRYKDENFEGAKDAPERIVKKLV